MNLLSVYLPMDRRHALARGVALAERSRGAALFADLSGFTPLTEALARRYGPRRGAEELTVYLNRAYDALIDTVHCFGGSVINFSGDAITCWFDNQHGTDSAPEAALRAVACGLAIQAAIQAIKTIRIGEATDQGMAYPLSVKVSIATGPAQRLLVGDPAIQLVEAVAGATVARMARGEALAESGEVVVDAATVALLAEQVVVSHWRSDPQGERFACVERLAETVAAVRWPTLSDELLPPELTQPWLLPAVALRLRSGQGEFLTELRPAVALFVRFGDLDYDHDPQAGLLLDRYIRGVQAVLARYEASMLQLTIGDKGSYLYAVFGAPIAHEDDVQRALSAVLELAALPTDLPGIGPVQVGLSTGTMRTGACGSAAQRTYAVLGDEVNLAARLMLLAKPGQVLASERVREASGVAGDWEILPPIAIKGRRGLVPIAQLLGASAPVGGSREPNYRLPMIGRTAELAQIRECLEQAANGKGQLISIVAEAGMGKSRLIAELVRMATRRGLRVYSGACPSYGSNIPFLAWRPIWRMLFGLDPSQSAELQATHLAVQLAAINPSFLPRLPLLGAVVDLPLADTSLTRSLDPQVAADSREALLLACLQTWALRSSTQPLVLIIEDAHWIDAASRDLLTAVARALASLPVLLVVAYRPAELTHFQPLRFEPLANCTRIELGALSAYELAQLVAARLGTTPPELISALIERAEGNPFYVEELLDDLRDRDLDPYDPRVVEQAALPSSLQSLVLGRIDRLDPQHQTTIKVASVIGRHFAVRQLHGYYPALGEYDQVVGTLEILRQHDLTPLDRVVPDRAYLFKHIVTQEVAYGSLAYATRAALHEQFAGYLEHNADQGGDELDLLAYHYERSLNRPRARAYLWRAGIAAAQRFANAEAASYLERAFELTPSEEIAERYAILLAREQVLGLLGERQIQAEALARLTELAGQLGDTAQAEVALRQARFAELTGDYEAAVAAAQATINSGQAAGAASVVARGYLTWGETLWRQADYSGASLQLEQALTQARQLGLPVIEAASLLVLGDVAADEGTFDQAESYYRQAVRIYEEIGDRQGVARGLNALGTLADDMGDDAQAHDYYNQALQIYQAIGDRRGQGLALGNLGVTAWSQGDHAAAVRYTEQAAQLCRSIDDQQGLSYTLNSLGVLTENQGNYSLAHDYYEQALVTFQAIGDQQGEGLALGNLGWVDALQGCFDQAANYAAQALAIFRTIGYQQGESQALALAGLLRHQQGDDAAAQALASEALAIATAIGVQNEQADALLLLGHACTGLGQYESAGEHYQKALELRREMQQALRQVAPLAGLARISQACGDLAQAQEFVELILNYQVLNILDAADEPLRVMLTCYRLLAAVDDARATGVLTEAHQWLQEHARLIADPLRRRSFLEVVPTNRAILALYAALSA